MAADEVKDQELEDFVTEYNLKNIAPSLYEAGVNFSELCSEQDEAINAFISNSSLSIKDQSKFREAIYDYKSKMEVGNEQKQDNENKIIIQGLNGKTLSLNISQTMTIKDIKKQIEQKEGWPQKQQKLVFGGKFLDDDSAKISQYDITKESVIHINITKKKDCCIL